MREILFRGKRVSNGEWVEGCNINTQFDIDGKKHTYIGVHQESKFYPLMKSIGWWFEVIPETVGQFTGLTGKNGKKIFEGDILKNFDDIGVVTYGIRNCGCCHGVYGFALCDKDGYPLDDIYSSFSEVIGNIFDNPELLENKN